MQKGEGGSGGKKTSYDKAHKTVNKAGSYVMAGIKKPSISKPSSHKSSSHKSKSSSSKKVIHSVVRKPVKLPGKPVKPVKDAGKSAWQKMKDIEKDAHKQSLKDHKGTPPGHKDVKKKSNALGQAGLDKGKYTKNTKTSTSVKKSSGTGKKTTTKKTVTKKTPVKTVEAPKKTNTGTGNKTTTTTKPSTLDNLWKQAQGYKTQLDAKMKAGFHYDATKDPSYQALEKIAQSNAAKASVQSMEDMNDRGILNSTITSDRDAQIKQSYQDSVTAQIPGLQAQAYGQWRDDVTNLDNLWTQSMSNWSGERNYQEGVREYNKTFNEGVRQYDQNYAASQKQQRWENNFQQNQADIGNSYKANQLTLDEMAADQKAYGTTSKIATNKALAELTGKNFKTGKDAMKYLSKNYQKYYNSGADFSSIIGTLSKRYSDFGSSSKGYKFPSN